MEDEHVKSNEFPVGVWMPYDKEHDCFGVEGKLVLIESVQPAYRGSPLKYTVTVCPKCIRSQVVVKGGVKRWLILPE